MANNHYSEFIQISPTFESVVDLAADQRNKDLWREYIVGRDMENLIEALCKSLNMETPDARRSFWIHGSYGTGKSYAALLVKHLLEEAPAVVDQYLGQNSRLSPYRTRFMKSRNKGDFMVVWRAGCTGIHDGNAMLMEAEKAIREALKAKFGDKADYGDTSLHDAVLKQLQDRSHNWDYILESTTLGDDYDNIEHLIQLVEAGDLAAIQRTAVVIRSKGWGLVDGLGTFKSWVKTVIESNGLSKTGIFFIWDEFTEYIANSGDHTVLQQLSEFSKETPFYMMPVIHRTKELLANLGGEDSYQKISDRFHTVEFHITSEAAYDLIAGSIVIKNGMETHWKEERKNIVARIKSRLADMEGADDTIAERIDQFCPVHPMTIKLLTKVADNYAGAQRTMFRFMKDNNTPDQGFVGYINKYGPDDQACWLTPDWLWDYFFTRTSDIKDEEKDAAAADYIRHYVESKYLVENNENALRVFKVSMLLMTVMSSTKGFYGGKRTLDGLSATVDCLKTCLAGVVSENQVQDLLNTLQDSRVLLLDRAANGIIHIQMPYAVGPNVDFKAKIEANDKKYSRYQMFSKDGAVSQEFEKMAWDENDASLRRMKIAICCAETTSINARLDEVRKELDKNPFKLGLLIVTVRDGAQALAIQGDLQKRAVESQEPRLIIALNQDPFTDEKRKSWLEAITKYEMAIGAGATADASTKEREAKLVITSWVSGAVSGGKITAWCENQVMTGIFGMANLRKQIRINVLDKIFPYAPEMVCITSTAYKACNEKTALAGIQRETNTAQLKNILTALQMADALELKTFEEMMGLTGSKASESIAALAKCIHDEIEHNGARVMLDELWQKLQGSPYGYYDNMVCGVLLGYVFSAFKGLGYTWKDSTQSPIGLTDTTISTLVMNMCKGKMTTDSLFAGTEAWRAFRDYLKAIFGLDDTAVADAVSGNHNVREVITKTGTPFWVVKYLPSDVWANQDAKDAAYKIVDGIQDFISNGDDNEAVMSSVVQLFNGRGKVRKVITDFYQDKSAMAEAFQNYLFGTSPQLQEIAAKLSIQPQTLSDKLHRVMQGAIYTWTEEQVAERTAEIVAEYRYLDVLNEVLGKVYQSGEAVKRDLADLFKHLRISMAAIERMQKDWYPALKILHRISANGLPQSEEESRTEEMLALQKYGTYAFDCLRDAKPVLADLLSAEGIDYTSEELDRIYAGLKDLSCDMMLTQFERELKAQLNTIKISRNRMLLRERWVTMTGTETVKDWCAIHKVPLLLLLSKPLQTAMLTLISVQQGQATTDAAVTGALTALDCEEMSILNDDEKLNALLVRTIGEEFADIWAIHKDSLISRAKQDYGNDMSTWMSNALFGIQNMLKKEQREQAKREKLSSTQAAVASMPERTLRDRIRAFLDSHPEYCDEFSK